MTLKKRNTFHDLELAFCGYSGSGKTTLICDILNRLSKRFEIGYVKHDAHQFQMDKEGKDTWKASHSGASIVSINNNSKSALLMNQESSSFSLFHQYVDCDFVFVEGYKKTDIPKIVVLGKDKCREKTLKELKNGLFENVLAVADPFYKGGESTRIEKIILDHFSRVINSRPLMGLVLAGGRSQRMQTDKGALSYKGRPQTLHLSQMLKPFCQEVFVSCRQEQSDENHLSDLNQLNDRLLNFGPTGGILSAMEEHPNATWLVVACDLPFLDEETLKNLINERNPFKVATCFLNPEKKWPEPLCSIYEPKAKIKLYQFLALGRPCPRKVLFNSNIKSIELKNTMALDNANTPQDFERAMGHLENQI